MIFKQSDQVLGIKQPLKSQTRRLQFPYELARQLHKHGWSYPRTAIPITMGLVWRWGDLRWGDWLLIDPITDADIADANCILSENIITLPVQPGRGKKAVGRIRITKIRRERLGDITDADAEAEGIFLLHDPLGWTWTYQGKEELHYFGRPRWAYHDLWESIYGKGAWDRMKDDDVWALEFECLKNPSPPSV